ncbi:hypothetical protein [Persephonella sp.]
MPNKILERFNAKLKNLDNINDLTLAVITKGSAGQVEYAFMKEILKDTDLLEKAIKIVISQNNPEFTSLLKSMLKHYIENCSDICRIDEFFIENLLSLDDFRYEKLVGLLYYLIENPEYLLDYKDEFIQLVKKANTRDSEKGLIFYEFLNLYSPIDLKETFELLKLGIQMFPDEEMLYEFQGHIALKILMEDIFEDSLDKAKKMLEEIYQWLVFRKSMEDKETDYPMNFVHFLTVYLEILILDEEFETADKVVGFLNNNLNTMIKNELNKFKDFDEETKSLMFQVGKEYTAHFIAVFGVLLTHVKKLSQNEAFPLAKEIVYAKNPFVLLTFGDFSDEELESFLLFEH